MTAVPYSLPAPGALSARLREVEELLPMLLGADTSWQSVFVDYEPPFVERLWTTIWVAGAPYRLFLHRIHPAKLSQCLFHPHPWPSAIKVLSGSYTMTCGFGAGLEPPPVAQTLKLTAGADYEMVHPDGWHAVCPTREPSLSLMLTGAPWYRPSHKPTKKLRQLTEAEASTLLNDFRQLYGMAATPAQSVSGSQPAQDDFRHPYGLRADDQKPCGGTTDAPARPSRQALTGVVTLSEIPARILVICVGLGLLVSLCVPRSWEMLRLLAQFLQMFAGGMLAAQHAAIWEIVPTKPRGRPTPPAPGSNPPDAQA